jgi:hypothetical protein
MKMDLECLDAAYHEAGHAYMILATGGNIREVWVQGEKGSANPEPLGWRGGIDTNADIAYLRLALLVDVAGCLAEEIEEDSDYEPIDHSFIRYLDEKEGLVHDPHPRRVSSQIRRSWDGTQQLKNPSDAYDALESAMNIVRLTGRDDTVSAHVMGEVIRAEVRAEEILREQWEHVQRVAISLCSRKSHRMTGKQVLHLLRKGSNTKGVAVISEAAPMLLHLIRERSTSRNWRAIIRDAAAKVEHLSQQGAIPSGCFERIDAIAKLMGISRNDYIQMVCNW